MNHAFIDESTRNGARAQILVTSWHLLLVLSLTQFPRERGQQARRGSGWEEISHPLSAGLFHVLHVCNTFCRNNELSAELSGV